MGEVISQICELSELLGPRTPDIIGLKITEYGDFTWRSKSLLSEKAERKITAKVYVFSDSILSQGEVNNPSGRRKLNGTGRITSSRIWMVSMVVRRNLYEEISQDPRWSERKFKNFMKSIQCEPEEFEGRIIFMSMFNEIEWRENYTECIHNSIEVRFFRGHWSFSGPGLGKTWYWTCTEKPNRKWDGTTASMILQLVAESGHPVFRASSASERRIR